MTHRITLTFNGDVYTVSYDPPRVLSVRCSACNMGLLPDEVQWESLPERLKQRIVDACLEVTKVSTR